MTERYQVLDVFSEPVQVKLAVDTLPVQGLVPTLLAFLCAAGKQTSDGVQPPSGLLYYTLKLCDIVEDGMLRHQGSDCGQIEPVEVEVAKSGVAGALDEKCGNYRMRGEKAACIGRTGDKEGLYPCCKSKHRATSATSQLYCVEDVMG